MRLLLFFKGRQPIKGGRNVLGTDKRGRRHWRKPMEEVAAAARQQLPEGWGTAPPACRHCQAPEGIHYVSCPKYKKWVLARRARRALASPPKGEGAFKFIKLPSQASEAWATDRTAWVVFPDGTAYEGVGWEHSDIRAEAGRSRRDGELYEGRLSYIAASRDRNEVNLDCDVTDVAAAAKLLAQVANNCKVWLQVFMRRTDPSAPHGKIITYPGSLPTRDAIRFLLSIPDKKIRPLRDDHGQGIYFTVDA